MSRIRNILAGVTALTAALSLAPTSASAANGNNGAFLGGLAVGVIGSAIVNGVGSQNQGYGYQPNGFYQPPVYVRRSCWYEVTPVYGAYGQYIGDQRVKRCN